MIELVIAEPVSVEPVIVDPVVKWLKSACACVLM